ncbi:TolC family outer membrane protein [Paraphotobacterium marinum]|uniref:TolC family outer membrane protein n=1 Tax=Paraphotobacterium marinum TaxID=1755811 RepID=UPI0039EBA5AF
MKNKTPFFLGFALLFAGTQISAKDLLSTYELAKKNDPTLLKSQAEKQEFESKIGVSKGLLLPQLDFDATYNHISCSDDSSASDVLCSPPDRQSVSNAELELTQALYQPSTWRDWKLAQLKYQAKNATYLVRKQNLIIRVTRAYFKVLNNTYILEQRLAEIDAFKSSFDLAEQQFKVGLVPITNVSQSKAKYLDALGKKAQAESELQKSLEELGILTGYRDRQLSPLNLKKFKTYPIPKKLDFYISDAKKYNLSILADRIKVQEAKKEISVKSAGALPSVNLTANYSLNHNKSNNDAQPYTDINNQYSYNGRENSIQIETNVPIYQGGQISSAVEASKFNYVKFSQDFIKTYRQVITETKQNYNNINDAIYNVQAYADTYKANESVYKEKLAKYKVGTETMNNVLQSISDLYDSKRILQEKRLDYLLESLKLKKSQGTLSDRDLIQVSKLFE